MTISADLPEALDDVVSGAAGAVLIAGGGAHALLTTLAHRTDGAGRPAFWVAGSAALQRLPFGALGGLVRLSDGDTPALMAQVCTQIAALDEPLVLIDDAHLIDPLSAVALHQLLVRGAVRVIASAPGAPDDGPVREFIGTLPSLAWDARAAGTVDEPGPADPTERRLLQALALAGDLGLDDAERMFGAAATAALETAGLVQVQQVGVVARLVPTNPRLAVAVLAELDRPARERLCSDLVRSLHARADADPRRVIQKALLMQQGRPDEHDVGLLVDAAQAARTVGNAALALEFATSAVSAGAGPAGTLILAELMTWSGAPVDAEKLFADLDGAPLDAPARARLVSARAANLHCNLGAGDEAEQLLARARSEGAPDGGVLDGLAVQFDLFRGDLDRVLRVGVPLAEAAAPDSPELVWLTTATAPALAAAGRWAEAERHVRFGFRASERTASGTQRFTLGLAATDSALAQGRIGRAREVCASLYERAAGEPQATAIVDALAGRVAFAAGEAHEAAASLRRAAEAARTDATPVWSAVVSAWYAAAAIDTGEADRARAACDYATATMPSYVCFYEPDLRLAQAAVAEDPHTAARYLSQGAERARSQGNLFGELRLRVRLVGTGATDQRAATAALAARFASPVAATLCEYADAAHAREPRALRAVAAEFIRLGWCPAARDAERAAAAATPSSAVLSDREREVVELVTGGFLNRDIADRLGVSTRTVEGHLYRVYAKLGVAGRRELMEKFS